MNLFDRFASRVSVVTDQGPNLKSSALDAAKRSPANPGRRNRASYFVAGTRSVCL